MACQHSRGHPAKLHYGSFLIRKGFTMSYMANFGIKKDDIGGENSSFCKDSFYLSNSSSAMCFAFRQMQCLETHSPNEASDLLTAIPNMYYEIYVVLRVINSLLSSSAPVH